ncbi:MAG TPA: YraN family protein [Holophagaceae bacterium]|nr:YraN family protein [Holophagaceae bacterium]
MIPRIRSSSRGEAARRWGARCERLTLWLLWFRGWELVAWREKLGRYELDLLVARGRELRLVEIKARGRGAWTGADTALTADQRLRLQRAFRAWLDRVPWPGDLSFQRVSWSGLCWHFHAPERWESLGIQRHP